MRQIQQIGRRAWLAQMAKGTFVVWAEVTFGLGRKGLSIAIGDDRLAGSVAQAQTRDPVQVTRVITDFVSSYVLVRGQEVAIVDTGLPNNGEKFGEVIKTAGFGWDTVMTSLVYRSLPRRAIRRATSVCTTQWVPSWC
jgi:hypothetical protein